MKTNPKFENASKYGLELTFIKVDLTQFFLSAYSK